jgi:hypothetical protein
MEIRYKLYPYPVLAEFSDDYQGDIFETTVTARNEGFDIVINVCATLTNLGLKNLIQEGKLKYAYHLECAQTSFRKVFLTDKESDSLIISQDRVSGKLEICSFIVAIDDITAYTNASFNQDYQTHSFDIESGCVIAVGQQININIQKEREDLAHAASVFSIIRNSDEQEKQMIVGIDSSKIVIKLPINDYYIYKQLNSAPESHAVLNSLTIIPALIYALDEVKLRSSEEQSTLGEYAWYRAVKKSLLDKFNIDIENNDFNDSNTVVLAQRLINDPMTRAFEVLRDGFGGIVEDDE